MDFAFPTPDEDPILLQVRSAIIRNRSLKRLGPPILDLLSHRQESLLNVGGVLCRGLEEGNVQLISEFLYDPDMSLGLHIGCVTFTNLCNAVLDNLLASQIGFVANEELVYAFRGITINLLEPLLHVGESVCIVA